MSFLCVFDRISSVGKADVGRDGGPVDVSGV